MNFAPVIPPLLALVLSPLLVGVINRTKAIFAGRNGPPLAQIYYDMRKLLAKGAVYSDVTTWVFRAGPIVSLASLILAAFVVPFATCAAPFHFQGDLIWFAYLLAVSRFISVLAALDTGSSFEGMGASRDVLFSALSEPAMLLGLAAVARQANGADRIVGGELQLSLTGIHQDDRRGRVGRKLAGLRAGGRRLVRGLSGRERPHSDRRPRHALGIDHDSRSDVARSRRARLRADLVRLGPAAVGVRGGDRRRGPADQHRLCAARHALVAWRPCSCWRSWWA